jgi:hypothetical protein
LEPLFFFLPKTKEEEKKSFALTFCFGFFAFCVPVALLFGFLRFLGLGFRLTLSPRP